MSIAMYLKVDGVTGESNDSNHKNWSDVHSFAWGAEQPGNMVVGGGGGAGKVQFLDLSVQAFIDKGTPAILKFCASGKHVNKVEISVCKAGGEQIEYSKITLEDVLVTACKFGGISETEGFVANYYFQAAKVNLHYWEQSNKGTKGAETKSGWNIKENKEI